MDPELLPPWSGPGTWKPQSWIRIPDPELIVNFIPREGSTPWAATVRWPFIRDLGAGSEIKKSHVYAGLAARRWVKCCFKGTGVPVIVDSYWGLDDNWGLEPNKHIILICFQVFLEEPTHRSPRKTTETMSPRIMGSSGCRPSCQGLKLQVGAALDFHLLTQTSGSRSWAHLPSCSVHEKGSGLRICINFMQIWVQYFF